VEAISRAGYTPGRDAAIALDIAASDLYDEKTGRYSFNLEKREFTPAEFCSLVADCAIAFLLFPLKTLWPTRIGKAGARSWKGWARHTNCRDDFVHHQRATPSEKESKARSRMPC